MITDHCAIERQAERTQTSQLTSAECKDSLRKRRLLRIFFVNKNFLRVADIDYLALQSMLAWRSYHYAKNIASFIKQTKIEMSYFRWPTSSSSLFWKNLVSTETAFTWGVKMATRAQVNFWYQNHQHIEFKLYNRFAIQIPTKTTIIQTYTTTVYGINYAKKNIWNQLMDIL